MGISEGKKKFFWNLLIFSSNRVARKFSHPSFHWCVYCQNQFVCIILSRLQLNFGEYLTFESNFKALKPDNFAFYWIQIVRFDRWITQFCISFVFLVYVKVNSVQEACDKCFAVHILKFEILQITWKKWNKEHQTLSFQFFTNRFSISMFFVLFFHVVCKISNFDKWTAKHLVQASCTELTLPLSLSQFFGLP